MAFFLRIYDFFAAHRSWCWTLLSLWICAAVIGALQLRLNEDITDFLPLNDEQQEQMTRYQQLSHAQRIVIVVEDTVQGGVDRVRDRLEETNASWQVLTGEEPKEWITMAQNICLQLPSYLQASDYERLDTLVTRKAVHEAMTANYNMLTLPFGAPMAALLPYDPLGWATPVLQRLAAAGRDGKQTYLFIDSPYPPAETYHNAALVDSIASALQDLPVRLTGGPVIAVGNARCIKQDSLVALTIAILLIAILLWRSLSSWRSVLLIVAATGFGFLTALGLMGVVHPHMSLIVIGIASIIVGIAVNYPLHLIVHRQYTDSPRQTLAEVVRPLVIGNITTVGAFLTLLPLQSTALRDLGLFCAAMLIGTILFTILFLPHIPFSTPRFDTHSRTSRWLDATSRWQPERHRRLWLTLIIVATIVLGYFAHYVRFDADMSHINYLTPQQRQDLQALVPAASENEERWQTFCEAHRDSVLLWLHEEAELFGFRPEAFSPFESLMMDNSEQISSLSGLQRAMTTSLSDNFNRIGWMCSLLVFAFLWLSFRRLKYAVIAFLPMAVSWLWILGIMTITGLSFNIVNIILASFIFGQGDDYTIFITEGLIQQRETGKEVLLQYKNAIALSALIMFIGIGALVIARHPALYSLGIVTVIGMSCVVLLAYLLPPLLFKNPK